MKKTIIYLILIVLSIHICASTSTDTLPDTLSLDYEIEEITLIGDAEDDVQKKSALSVESVTKEDMRESFSGNLLRSLEQLPGIQSMSVGSGYSKPMIRGMGFNRVCVTENGVKQEGQQWGSDHGLEIDAFNIEGISIRKGPSSLLYGSDAIGGVMEVLPPKIPTSNKTFAGVDLLARSVNGTLAGSLMLATKQKRWFFKARYTEQHFGDLRVPTDTIVYLTQRLPLANSMMNNTAGLERSGNVYLRYGAPRYSLALALSDSYQKAGFFAGAHGVPDASKIEDDGNRYDIDLPYSFVNHFKSTLHFKYFFDAQTLTVDMAYQNNHREEWSEFHTHYGNQAPPLQNPNRELAFMMNTYSVNAKLNIIDRYDLKLQAAADFQYIDNDIAGYSFLIPEYDRTSCGVAMIGEYMPIDNLNISAGVRLDGAHLSTKQYEDEYLSDYLSQMGYDNATIDEYRVRSYAINRNWWDYSLSFGAAWSVDEHNSLKLNVGRSYRLPGANELASNGVHHSSFRHEQGDANLDSEHGWQIDAAYSLTNKWLLFSVSPFASWYLNYIYLQPSGKWSILPHAGQIYKYCESEAIFLGAELSTLVSLPCGLSLDVNGEYVFSYNIDEYTALPLTPPFKLNSTLAWRYKILRLSASWQFIADQNLVARNEDRTEGANLLSASVSVDMPFITKGASITLSVDNILNTKYLNHLSFYRKIEAPEPGRNIQLLISLPINN